MDPTIHSSTNLQKKINQLQKGELLRIDPDGTSMCPTFYGGRDYVNVTAPTFPLKKGDIPIFLRDNGPYVIHRICKIKKNGNDTLYYMLGDNQTWIEGPIREDQIHAVVSQIIRKGRTVDCKTNKKYLLWVKFWLFIRPLRPLCQKLHKLIKNS